MKKQTITPEMQERLLRHAEGSLPILEAQALAQQMAASAALQAAFSEIKQVRRLAQQTADTDAETALKPFFADRLMRRLEASARKAVRVSPDEELFRTLVRLFRPVALAGVLVIALLVAFNVSATHRYEAEATPTEAVLGLPPVTLAVAYDLDSF